MTLTRWLPASLSLLLRSSRLGHLNRSRSTTSVAQIAKQLHLASGTVRNYLSSAMIKLNAVSRHDAAEKAWQQGWI